MKRLYNRPESAVAELIEGMAALHPHLASIPEHGVVVRADFDRGSGRVALVSGGGSGHEPAHAGYVGPGMLTAAVAGDVFTSPSVDAVLAAIRAVAGPSGVLLIVKNYTGDRLNFGLAAEIARAEGVAVEVVIVADDVALLDPDPRAEPSRTGARGLAGTILVHKVAGAAAEAGLPLDRVADEARRAASEVATMGVGLTPCTVPAAGRPSFELGDGEVELGLGIHGEPGARRGPVEPADALAARLVDAIGAARDRRIDPTRRVALLVNGLGGSTPMELSIVARGAIRRLEALGLSVERAWAGTFLSSLEMGGFSLSVLDLDGDRLARLDAPTLAPGWPVAAPRAWPAPRLPVDLDHESADRSANVADPAPSRAEGGIAFRRALERVAKALIADAPRLTDLDAAVGDGDLGISLKRGAEAILGRLDALPLGDPSAALRALGDIVRRSLGGSSGPLLAVGLTRASARLAGLSVPVEPPRWAEALADAVAGIADLGGAQPGDRTMLDALAPALEAFQQSVDAGQSLADSIEAAARAAREGAEATRRMHPRLGRSSYLGDRAIGHPDPGAEAVATWLKALADA